MSGQRPYPYSTTVPTESLSPFSEEGIKLVNSPNPEWQPGQTQNPPEGKVLSFDAASLEARERYGLMISGIVPRPIALVTTVSKERKIVNMAPYSFFNALSSDPPTLIVSTIHNRHGAHKDTLVNARETGHFVVNIMSEHFIESANHTCGNFPFEVDETEYAGIKVTPAKSIDGVVCAHSLFAMECKTIQLLPLFNDAGQETTCAIIGRVVRFHIHESVYDAKSKTIILEKYRPVARLGGVRYATVNQVFELQRPFFADGKAPPKPKI
ncbi:hypothetical protein M427DRAFT_57724 [Gonapodya prolifera JEL478]|uniref:Flavin reductase like domain-containing protein n=1 Tax=Gonapodya prolifera (strain JEL478) TaxID=1344416 RepID=A0A139ACW5_GONPJ|nr:hypothetical protein M427DRAFT_57724 [Gonapodya prolifera JEL478]|eukprot:KXS14253.1 hypothetical protein M427DRAFT_57724 [Gonapodya prolifera JEL478]